MTSPRSAAALRGRWTPAQRFALLLGVVYLLVAVAGFAITGLHPFSGMQHHTLVVFAVNPLHNVIHAVLAVVWLAAAWRPGTARIANIALGVVLGLVTVLGFVGGMGMLGMNGLADPDNFLHLASATLALYFGSVGADPARSEDDDFSDEPEAAAV